MASPLNFKVKEKDNALYVCLEGDLDEGSFQEVTRVLADRPIDRPVHVDLHKIRYADSTGLRALVLLQRQARDAGEQLILLEPSEAIKRVFQSTGLETIFKIQAKDEKNPCQAGAGSR